MCVYLWQLKLWQIGGLRLSKSNRLREKRIYTHFSGYGPDGPENERPGFDVISFWARGGAPIEWSKQGERPVQPFFGFGDSAVSALVVSSVMLALYNRQQTGQGEFVQPSLFGTGLWYNSAGLVLGQRQYGIEYPKDLYDIADPLSIYHQTKDGDWFVFSSAWEHKAAFLKMLGLEQYENDPRFMKPTRETMPELVRIFEEAFSKVSSKHVDECVRPLDIVYDKLTNPRDLTTDAQALANRYIEELEFKNGNKTFFPANPVKFANIEPAEMKVAPALGVDSLAVLQDLGYSDTDIKNLTSDGSVIQYQPK